MIVIASRTVAVTLTAQVSGYIAGMEQARKKTQETSDDAQKKTREQGQAFSDLGGLAMKGGLVAAAGIALAISKFAEFDEAISNVKAATQETAENMDRLREAALEAGAATVFSATEAANAIEELGKAGLTTQEILSGGLSGSLALASAGQLDVARAAEVAAITMKQFKLEGKDVPHIADLLAAGAGKAAGDVEDMAQALAQVGLVAKGTGLTVEETTGALSAFASAGLIGSDSGTSFKTMLSALIPKSEEAGKAMAALGFSAYDQNGNFVGLAEVAGRLRDSMTDLTQEQRAASLQTIFGSDAIRAARVLYDEGREGIQGYIDATNDSGYAAQVAADRLDNLKGDVEKLGGAFDTALIRSGSGANDVLRQITQNVTFLVDVVGSAPEPLLNAGLAFGVVTAAMLLTGGGALSLVPKFAALKATVAASGVSMGSFALKAAAVGGALSVATIAVGIFVGKQAEAAATTRELQESLDKATGAATGYTRELVAKKLAEVGAFEAAEKAGISQKKLTDSVFEGGDALDEVKGKLADLNKNPMTAFTDIGFKSSAAQTALGELSGGLVQSKKNLKDEQEAMGDAADATESAGEAYVSAAEDVEQLSSNLSELIETINAANKQNQDAIAANASYRASVAESKAEVEKFLETSGRSSKNLDESTAAGSANADMLANIAGKSQEAARAQFELDGNTEAYNSRLQSGRSEIYKTALALTGNAKVARELAARIYDIPSQREIKIIADTNEAKRKIEAVVNALRTARDTVAKLVITGSPGGKADGGAISGPGSGTSDTAGLYRLSNGEHVLTAADVERMGGQRNVYEFRESLYKGYASGGAVGASPVAGSSGGGGLTISIPMTVSTLALDNPDAFVRAVVPAIKTAVRDGVIPSDWSTGR